MYLVFDTFSEVYFKLQYQSVHVNKYCVIAIHYQLWRQVLYVS